MPYRKNPLVTGEVYHVFNRSVAKQPIFMNYHDYNRFFEVINFYRFKNLPKRYSHYNRLSMELKSQFRDAYMIESNLSLEIISYCIMPNHFHFLVRPLEDNMLSYFVRNLQHSYSKYFNTKYKRTGSLFQGMFKAVRIETDGQLLHVSRYIHLNPVTAYLIAEKDLESYPWSSLKDYFSNEENTLSSSALILNHFKSPEEYKKFIFDQVDYQRELAKIKHLLLE